MAKNLDYIRHSLAHLLAAAVLELYPDARPTIGPAIENGFYYDFDNLKVSDSDLKAIEKKMKKLLPSWKEFSSKEVSADEARKHFKDNPYKLELIEDLAKEGETITFYTSGNFIDLCRGGHVDSPATDIDPNGFKLDRVAGAYWRGDENKPQLTRIYGLAFEDKKELDAYLEMREEAKKRDHRKIGKELDLFTFSEKVGPGLPLWTPKGTLMRHLLDDFVWQLRKERGYKKVEIPHITKKDLFVTSGHWDKFSDGLFKTESREGHMFALKPMNCPFHTQIFARKKYSYRDMPERYANTTTCYRDEQSGELHGLSRVRAFAQDDAHVFCREDQIKEEAFKIWDIVETFYGAFGFDLRIGLSVHDPDNMDKYLGDIKDWDTSVGEMKSWLKERGAKYSTEVGEAAFYGPKIDFIAKDSLGREWQVATIQVDGNMPKNFELTYTNERGEEAPVFMLHAAIMGSLERFMSVFLEHSAGNFPLWISPVQVKVLPIGEGHIEYAAHVVEELDKHGLRAELDDGSETLGKKIRNWKVEKVPYALVIGDNEVKDKAVTVESRDGEKENMSTEELVEKLTVQANNRE